MRCANCGIAYQIDVSKMNIAFHDDRCRDTYIQPRPVYHAIVYGNVLVARANDAAVVADDPLIGDLTNLLVRRERETAELVKGAK